MTSGRKDVVLRHQRIYHPDEEHGEPGSALPSNARPHPITTLPRSRSLSASRVPLNAAGDIDEPDFLEGTIIPSANLDNHTPLAPSLDWLRVPPTGEILQLSSLSSPQPQGDIRPIELNHTTMMDSHTVPESPNWADLNLDFFENWQLSTFTAGEPALPNQVHTPQSNGLNSHLGRYRLAEPAAISSDPATVLVSELELSTAQSLLDCLTEELASKSITLPSRYGVIRYIRAYSCFFAPHTPLLPLQTFNISTSHPILTLAVLSIGAVLMDETVSGWEIHQNAVTLLRSREEKARSRAKETLYAPWEFLARILCCVNGVFAGDSTVQRQEIISFWTMTDLVQHTIRRVHTLRQDSWPEWLERQGAIRCVAWYIIMAGILSSLDHRSFVQIHPSILDTPFPASDELWMTTPTAWSSFQSRSDPPGTISLAFHELLSGRKLSHAPNSFGMLIIIAAFRYHIQSLEYMPKSLDPYFRTSISESLGRALTYWEQSWRDETQGFTRARSMDDPLLMDALAFLNSGIYHLASGNQIQWMKAVLWRPQEGVSAAEFGQSAGIVDCSQLERALIRAVTSLGLRARHGINHIVRTGPLRFATYQFLSGYDGGTLLAWYSLGKKLNQPPLNDDRKFPKLVPVIAEMAAELRKSGIRGSGDLETLLCGFEILLSRPFSSHISNHIFEGFQQIRKLVEGTTPIREPP